MVSSRLGVAVISYNSEEDLPKCLEALKRAKGVEQILVVDNASKDESAEIARAAGSVTVVVESVNTGFAGGCNRGYMELSPDHEFLAFLNPDVDVSPDCLDRCCHVLEADSNLAGVAPLMMRPDGVTVDSAGQVLKYFTLEVRDRGYGRSVTADVLESKRVLAPCGALAVYRRAALESVIDSGGPWAQHFFCFWEDFELGWRLVNSGWEIRSVPEALATHRRGGGASDGHGPLRWRRPPELEACVISNRWMTLIRHLHPLDLALRVPLLLMWDLSLVAVGVLRRPSLFGLLRQRWPIVVNEWHSRGRFSRRRLREVL